MSLSGWIESENKFPITIEDGPRHAGLSFREIWNNSISM